ncbi:MAG: hypothetical protein KGL75_13135 [Acidobacteriota bacterium]|nr:hypothetical protein [Acidobacteriota bacterium]
MKKLRWNIGGPVRPPESPMAEVSNDEKKRSSNDIVTDVGAQVWEALDGGIVPQSPEKQRFKRFAEQRIRVESGGTGDGVHRAAAILPEKRP